MAAPGVCGFYGLVPMQNFMTDLIHSVTHILILLLCPLPAIFFIFCTTQNLRKYISATGGWCGNLIKDMLQGLDDRNGYLSAINTRIFSFLAVEAECLTFILKVIVVVFQASRIHHVKAIAEILGQK